MENYQVSKPPLVRRMRFQLPGAILVAIVIPLFIRMNFDFGFDMKVLYAAQTVNSTIGAVSAIILGYFAWRRIDSYATVEASSYVLWSSLPFFLGVMAFFFFFRIEYSIFIFFSAMILTQLWFVILHLYMRTRLTINFGVVEGGSLGSLPQTRRIRFVPLTEPVSDFKGLNGVVMDLRHDHQPQWLVFATDLTLMGIPVYHYRQIEEEITGMVSMDHLSENSFGTLLPDLFYLKVKNRLEQLLALVSLPFVVPLAAMAALALLIKQGRPVIFAQKRMGFRGRPFIAYKFRTMVNHATGNTSLEDAMTKDNDPRVTPLGRMLRKYRLDELPQILNILRGEMGWIGPRPEAIALSRAYEQQLPFYRYRFAVRPGITGWAQVNQGHVTEISDIHAKLKYDFYYIKHVSIWLDFLILLKTVRIVLFGIGSK